MGRLLFYRIVQRVGLAPYGRQSPASRQDIFNLFKKGINVGQLAFLNGLFKYSEINAY
jgi:hypothetical protein